MFFSKNNAQNDVEKLIPDPFLQRQNSAYLGIDNLKSHTVCFYCMSKLRTSKIY